MEAGKAQHEPPYLGLTQPPVQRILITLLLDVKLRAKALCS